MQYYNATITPTTTGVFTINCGFQPTEMEIIVSAKNSTDSLTHLSIGTADNTWSTVHSIFQDTTGGRTYRKSAPNTDVTSEIVAVQERTAGTITKVNAARFHSFNAINAKFEVTTLTQQYQYNVRLRG